jgi:hypothetical protein
MIIISIKYLFKLKINSIANIIYIISLNVIFLIIIYLKIYLDFNILILYLII